MKEKCTIQGCKNPVWVRKHMLCNAHAIRLYRGKKIEGKIRKITRHEPYNAK